MLLIAVCDDIPLECADIAKQIETILKQSNTDFMIKKFFGGLEPVSYTHLTLPTIGG